MKTINQCCNKYLIYNARTIVRQGDRGGKPAAEKWGYVLVRLGTLWQEDGKEVRQWKSEVVR